MKKGPLTNSNMYFTKL